MLEFFLVHFSENFFLRKYVHKFLVEKSFDALRNLDLIKYLKQLVVCFREVNWLLLKCRFKFKSFVIYKINK